MSLNHIVLMGRLTRDPELRRTASGIACTTTSIAVDRDGKEAKANFFDLVSWRNTAEYFAKSYAKGQMVVVAGHLDAREWTDKHKQKRVTVEVVVDNIYHADGKRVPSEQAANASRSNNAGAYGAYHRAAEAAQDDDYAIHDDMDDDEEPAQLPF